MFFDSHRMICLFADSKVLKNIKHWKSHVQFQHSHSITDKNTKHKRLQQHGFNGIEFCSKFKTPINLQMVLENTEQLLNNWAGCVCAVFSSFHFKCFLQ